MSTKQRKNTEAPAQAPKVSPWTRLVELAKHIYYTLGALHYVLWFVVGIGLLGIGWLAKLGGAFHGSASPHDTASAPHDTATAPDEAATAPKELGLTATQFFAQRSKYENLTSLQRAQFLAAFVGRSVEWEGTVYDAGVSDEAPLGGMFVIIEAPNGLAICRFDQSAKTDLFALTKGQSISITGIIKDPMRESIGQPVVLKDCKLKKAWPVTETPKNEPPPPKAESKKSPG